MTLRTVPSIDVSFTTHCCFTKDRGTHTFKLMKCQARISLSTSGRFRWTTSLKSTCRPRLSHTSTLDIRCPEKYLGARVKEKRKLCWHCWLWWMLSTRSVWDSCLESDGTTESEMMRYYNGPVWLHCPISCPVDASRYLGIWLDLTTTHRQTWLFSSTSTYHSKPTSWPHAASPTWSSTEQVARPATKRFLPSDWRGGVLSPWTWWCNDAMALASYATMMMMMMLTLKTTDARCCRAYVTQAQCTGMSPLIVSWRIAPLTIPAQRLVAILAESRRG